MLVVNAMLLLGNRLRSSWALCYTTATAAVNWRPGAWLGGLQRHDRHGLIGVTSREPHFAANLDLVKQGWVLNLESPWSGAADEIATDNQRGRGAIE